MSGFCQACGETYQKGKRAVVWGREEGRRPRSATVCPKCAKGGVLFVAVKLAPVAVKLAPVVKEARSADLDRVIRRLKTYAAAAKATAVTAHREGDAGAAESFSARAGGLETAISTVEAEAKGRLGG